MNFLDTLNAIIEWIITRVLWTDFTFTVMLGVGLLFTVWSKFIQYRALTHGVRVARGDYAEPTGPGAITHFQALSAALSGTVGLGNIGGVALAIALGGPGALFWMWITGFLGMAIKSVEVTLAMMYRDTSDPDNPHGGAMWVIRRGIGDKYGGIWRPIAWWAGAFFCGTLMISTFTGGNMFQAWNVGNITQQYFGVPSYYSGIILAVATAAVILGGIRRIGEFTGFLAPFMCGLYLLAGIAVLALQAANIPGMLVQVVRCAFSPTDATGAFLGASAWFCMQTGLRRALFSNEAGQGTSPMAHSAARTKEPVSEGCVAGLEPFIDTCLVCTLTALVILSTNTWNREEDGFVAQAVVLAPDGRSVEKAPEFAGALDLAPGQDPLKAGDYIFLVAEDVADPGKQRAKVRARVGAADSESKSLRLDWEKVGWSRGEPQDPQLLKFDGRVAFYREFTGAALTGLAFDRAIPGLGKYLVTLVCWLFAYSTLITWSYYGENGIVYLFGSRFVVPYRIVFCLGTVFATLPGFIKNDNELGYLSDLGTGAMLFANVPIIVLMAPRAMAAFRDYFRRLDSGAIRPSRK